MPVVFVLLKGVKKSSTYGTLLRYFRTRTRSSRNVEDESHPVEDAPQKKNVKLPTIPKPTMTGLMSFIRHGDRSQRGQATEMSSYSELGSVNVDYNRELKETWSRS